jgi:NAD(P)-dependent dehydrogenase (short-subunit alcohol dehydrogenase family)
VDLKRLLTIDGFESQLCTNHFGHFLFCNLLFDQVEELKDRIIVVSSNGYSMGLKKNHFDDMNCNNNYIPMNPYCRSKLARMVFAYDLQRSNLTIDHIETDYNIKSN